MHKAIASPAAWHGPDIAKRQDWIHDLTVAELAEIETARATARQRGKTLETLAREDFPLPTLGRHIAVAQQFLETGPGLFLFRGIETGRYTKDELRFVYWGLGKHLGTAMSQSKHGDLLGDVRDVGSDIHGMKGRGYKSSQHLPFHCDSVDVTGLFVLRTAKTGGLSMLASSLAIHNKIARARPDLLEILYQPFYWAREGYEQTNEPPFYAQPIYAVQDGHFACRCISSQIYRAQKFPETPRLTAQQKEAIDLVESIARDERFHFAMMFQPGDLQLINNHVIFHARTEFEDDPEEDRRRHLLRMWLSMPNSRPLSPAFSAIYKDGRAGMIRGGYPSRTGKYIFETVGANLD